MEENGHGSGNGTVDIPRLRELAEFRFQLRQFLSFSEISSERHGIQAQQYQLLQVIAAAPAGQPASVSYLADRMVLRHNSTVELVDRAERAGLVRRHTDERDLRRSIIKLTPTGDQLLRMLVAEHVQELERLAERIVHSLRAVGFARPDAVAVGNRGRWHCLSYPSLTPNSCAISAWRNPRPGLYGWTHLPSITNWGMARLPVFRISSSAAPGVRSMSISWIRNRVLGQKALGLAAVAAPVGCVKKKAHTSIFSD